MMLPIPEEVTRRGQSKLPQILVRPIYRGRDLIRPVGYETVDAVAGVIIERNGRRYQVRENGSQRRIR